MIYSKSNSLTKHCKGKRNPTTGNNKEIAKAARVGLLKQGQAGSRGNPCTNVAAHEKVTDIIKITNISY